MPHALDLRQLELAWQFMKRFSRGKDGSLHIDRNAPAAKRPDALRPQQMGGMEKKRREWKWYLQYWKTRQKRIRMKEVNHK